MQRPLDSFARLAAVALLFTTASSASAQDSRWTAWVGCWQPIVRTQATTPSNALICIRPAGTAAVEIVTVDSAKVIATDTIDASGARTPLSAQGCSGWRRGEWSGDGRRVYLRSELECSGGITRTSIGILAFSGSAEWVDVQHVRAGKSKGTRATRYSLVGSWLADAVPRELHAVLLSASGAGNMSRMLAASEIESADVVDATKHVDAPVVETWLVERGQPFEVGAKELMRLADAGVPGSVTDVMIGLSYPERFALARKTEPDDRSRRGGTRGSMNDSYMYSRTCSQVEVWDPYWYPQSAYDPCYRNAYRYGYGYGYGYGGYYGYGSYGYYSPVYTGYYSSPVIIVDRRKADLPHGTMVKGEGYTRGRSSGNSATDEISGGSRGGSSSSAPRSRGSSSSGSTSSGSSSSGSSSTGRTAVKKGG